MNTTPIGKAELEAKLCKDLKTLPGSEEVRGLEGNTS
jgi:hypothetical protein